MKTYFKNKICIHAVVLFDFFSRMITFRSKHCLRKDASQITIRVLTGGWDSTQTGPFSSALISSRSYFDISGSTTPTVEYLSTDRAKQLKWGITEIVDWLLAADIHYILNHVHQGILFIKFT